MEFLWEMTRKIRQNVCGQAKEVYAAHREEIYRAIRVVCRCSDLVENEREWFGKMKNGADGWRSVDWERTLKDLKTVLDHPEKYLGESVPLADFLQAYADSLLETFSNEESAVRMLSWFEEKQYTGCEALQAYIYLLGLQTPGQGPMNQLVFFESLIPEGGREGYLSFSLQLLEELKQKREAYVRKEIQRRFQEWEALERTEEEIHIQKQFCEVFGNMEDDLLYRAGRYWTFREEEPETEVLTAAMLYGDARLRERCLEKCPETGDIMNGWMRMSYVRDREQIREAAQKMLADTPRTREELDAYFCKAAGLDR